jgi:hypothetical protein
MNKIGVFDMKKSTFTGGRAVLTSETSILVSTLFWGVVYLCHFRVSYVY